MLLENIMDRDVPVCTEDVPLEDVLELMDTAGTDHVFVVENYAHRKPIGVITEHDICRQVVGRGRNPRGLTAANVMNTRLVRLNADRSLSECSDIMCENGSKIACVIDGSGVLSGSVARDRLLLPFTAAPSPASFRQQDRIF
jgi:CBS domain-containing protein